MLTIGLVVEGPHDLIMLEPLIRYEIREKFEEEVRFRRLQPVTDATGTFNRGGCSKVTAWCEANSGPTIETFFQPLFAGDPPCDVIVIHLDGDTLELTNHLRAQPHGLVNPQPAVRVQSLVALLQNILKLEEARRRRVAYAIPVLETEAWMLGAENQTDHVERINAKTQFRKNFDRKTHRNLESFYTSRMSVVLAGIEKLANNCLSYIEFRNSIGNLDVD